MANTARGPDRRGGVKAGTNWTRQAAICWQMAQTWQRIGHHHMFEVYTGYALKIIANHSRSVVTHVQALELLDRLEAGR